MRGALDVAIATVNLARARARDPLASYDPLKQLGRAAEAEAHRLRLAGLLTRLGDRVRQRVQATKFAKRAAALAAEADEMIAEAEKLLAEPLPFDPATVAALAPYFRTGWSDAAMAHNDHWRELVERNDAELRAIEGMMQRANGLLRAMHAAIVEAKLAHRNNPGGQRLTTCTPEPEIAARLESVFDRLANSPRPDQLAPARTERALLPKQAQSVISNTRFVEQQAARQRQEADATWAARERRRQLGL